jgi:hypothetical protein
MTKNNEPRNCQMGNATRLIEEDDVIISLTSAQHSFDICHLKT